MSLEITCPGNCDVYVPKVKFSECAPTLLEGQITDILVGNIGYPLTNFADAAEWASRIDNDLADASAIRHFTVIGSLNKPEASEKTISHNRIVQGKKTFTLPFRIDDNTDENYDAARSFQCGLKNAVWFITGGGYLYGGNSGIEANINIAEVIPEAGEEFAYLDGEVKWKAKISPSRTLSPIVFVNQ